MTSVSNDEDFFAVILPAVMTVASTCDEEQRGRAVVRQRMHWRVHSERLLLEGEFKQYYRMSFAGFKRLLSCVGAELSVDPLQSARRALGEPAVSPAGMLQACICWLAGGSFHHIRVITGTSRAGFYRIIHAVIRVVNNCAGLDIRFPKTNDEMEDAAAGFRSISKNGAIPGCIGAIDGWLCPIRVPRRSECGRVVAFFSGHYQRYGLNIQACADHRCKFTAMASRSPGGRNDSVAFLQWSLSKLLSEVQGPYFVVADNAYPQSRAVLTPFNQAQLHNRPDRDSYNFYLSQCRIRIEMTFGLLVNKWRILKRPLCVQLKYAPHLIHACMRLHNHCIDQHALENALTSGRVIKAMRSELRTWNGTRDLTYTQTQFETEGGDVVSLLDEETRSLVVKHIAAKELHRPTYNLKRREELIS